MKKLPRIFGVLALCFTAVDTRASQAQPAASGSRHHECSNLCKANGVHDPSTNFPLLDENETLVLTQFVQQATTHPLYPGLNHSDISHQVTSNSLDGVIDTCSLNCLGCHDGIAATETKTRTAGEWVTSSGFNNRSHPIGIDYNKARSRSSDLKPAAFLPPEIILPEGKVGCESCHNLYSAQPNYLVRSNTGSALCLECHTK